MRIFFVTDVHDSKQAATMIRDELRRHQPDVLVVGGDFTHSDSLDAPRELLEGVSLPTLAVPGNCDPPGIVPVLEELGVNLHGKKTRVAEHTFVGIGGRSDEEEIERLLRPLMEPDVVLVSHRPPKNTTVDVVFEGEHVGSDALRTVIEKFEPPVVLCGHIHQARGTDRVKSSLIVNAGPALEGHAAVVDLDGETRVQLIKI